MTCKTCQYMVAHESMPGMGYCYFSPPVVQFIPFAVPPTAKEQLQGKTESVQMSPVSARPLVQDAHFCSHYTLSVAVNPH